MKNKVTLQGVLRDIKYSHNIKDIEFNKANLIVTRTDGKADIITLKFKSLCNPYVDNQLVSLTGNIRSYTTHIDDKNKVEIYVFTYFDKPEISMSKSNVVELEGVVCSIDDVRQSTTGKHSIRFTLANNLNDDSKYKFDNYIPCVVYGKDALTFKNTIKPHSKIRCIGEFHSREYRKYIDDEMEIRVAFEISISEFEVLV